MYCAQSFKNIIDCGRRSIFRKSEQNNSSFNIDRRLAIKSKHTKSIAVIFVFLVALPLGRYLYHEWQAKKAQPFVRLHQTVSRIAAKCPLKFDEYIQLQRLALLPKTVIRAEYRLLQVHSADIPPHQIPILMADAKKDAVNRLKKLIQSEVFSEIDIIIREVYTDKKGKHIFEYEIPISKAR